jgi:hypothetical protein
VWFVLRATNVISEKQARFGMRSVKRSFRMLAKRLTTETDDKPEE